MKRRVLLGAVGSVVSLATLGYATRPPVDTLEVRVWFSERAASYEVVAERVIDYLEALLDFDSWSLELSTGGIVPVSIEDGARVTSRGEWPRRLASGVVGRQNLEPVADVNLLVTDGQMTTAPTGYGIPHVASVGGARHLAALEPFDELIGGASDREAARRIVPNTRPTRTIQVLLHEVGHALGLDHEHGISFRYGDSVVATPMLSSYAWSADGDYDESRCGTSYPDPAGRQRKLSLAFSECARRELESYSGGLLL